MISVIKIGGNVIDNDVSLENFLKEFANYPSSKILVHGGGKLATRMSEKLNIQTTMIEGRRVTDAETLKVVTMVYAGWVNKNITAKLQAINCNAIGLSGADAGIIRATRRSEHPINYGYVGDISTQGVNANQIKSFIDMGLVPVFCSITSDIQGSLLNCNADTIASAIAMSMAKLLPTTLVYCFEKQGVLRNENDNNSLIPEITKETYKQLKEEGVIKHGMIPKLDNAFKAINEGVKEVYIKHSENLNNNLGTLLV